MATQLVPTAERPLLGDTRLKMLKALEEESLAEMCYFLKSEMMKCLEKDNSIPLQKTRQALAEDKTNGSPLVKLLHSIPRKLTKSLVMGTLAYDFHPLQHNEKYPDDGAGSYAIVPYIEERNGKFLNNKEMQRFIDDLKRYIDAYHANQRHQNNDHLMSLQDKELRRFSNAVDKASKDNWTPRDGVKLRWIQGKSTCNAINAFRDSLIKRVGESPDTTGDVYHEQAPIYVGCSNKMDGRMPHHSPKSTLSDTGLGLGLLLSLLKYQGLLVDVVAIPVVRAWEDGMLPLSEILVTLLAQSLAEQGGMNVIEPGTQNRVHATASACAARLNEELETVAGRFTFLKDNADATNKAIKQHETLVADMEELRIACQPANVQSALSLAGDVRSLEMLDKELDQMVETMRDLVKKSQEENDLLRQQYDAICDINEQATFWEEYYKRAAAE